MDSGGCSTSSPFSPWTTESWPFQSTLSLFILFSRKITAIINPEQSSAPLGWDVGGPSLLFLIIDTVIYWVILALIEYGALARCLGRNQANPQIKKEAFDLTIDEDILEEERRVMTTDKA